MSTMEEVAVVPDQWTEYQRSGASPVVIWASGTREVLVKIAASTPTSFRGCDILHPRDREEYTVEAADKIYLRSLTARTTATCWRGG